MVELFNLTEDSLVVVTTLERMGHKIVLEFKPKVDWPKEDEEPKDERYVFSCTLTPECEEWVTTVASCPNEAILNVVDIMSDKLKW